MITMRDIEAVMLIQVIHPVLHNVHGGLPWTRLLHDAVKMPRLYVITVIMCSKSLLRMRSRSLNLLTKMRLFEHFWLYDNNEEEVLRAVKFMV